MVFQKLLAGLDDLEAVDCALLCEFHRRLMELFYDYFGRISLKTFRRYNADLKSFLRVSSGVPVTVSDTAD